jgi:hypothetical protein
MIHLNDARITYVTFDFHEHWWDISTKIFQCLFL